MSISRNLIWFDVDLVGYIYPVPYKFTGRGAFRPISTLDTAGSNGVDVGSDPVKPGKWPLM